MAPFLLVVHFLLLLVFGGYASGWKMFDAWIAGGAIACGALLFSSRPIRIHLLSLYLVPLALILFLNPADMWEAHRAWVWCGLASFLFVFIPSRPDPESVGRTFLETVWWCAAVLTGLYIAYAVMDIPVRGFGYARSAEAQILLCALAYVLSASGHRRWMILKGAVLLAGIALNGSRSALLGTGVIIAVYGWTRCQVGIRKLAVVAVVTLVLVGTLTVVRMRADPHAELRPQMCLQAAQIFAENPMGSGVGTYLTESMARNFPVVDPTVLSQYGKVHAHAHNVVLQWAAESGILGMATILAFMICAACLVIHAFRRKPESVVARTALIWMPAFVLEILLNVTETLSPFRWMALTVLAASTSDFSVKSGRYSASVARVVFLCIGAGFLYTGYDDIMARQSLRAGLLAEQSGRAEPALGEYLAAHRIRPWDEQPVLHAAQAAIRAGRTAVAEQMVDLATEMDEGRGAAFYHGSRFCRMIAQVRANAGDTAGAAAVRNKARYLMRALNESQPYDVPRWLDGVEWSRGEAEELWRLRRAVSLEPRAARAYARLAHVAERRGDAARSVKLAEFAAYLRRRYAQDNAAGLEIFSPWNRNLSRYERALIDNVPSL